MLTALRTSLAVVFVILCVVVHLQNANARHHHVRNRRLCGEEFFRTYNRVSGEFTTIRNTKQ